jgi:hypothetical protein
MPDMAAGSAPNLTTLGTQNTVVQMITHRARAALNNHKVKMQRVNKKS